MPILLERPALLLPCEVLSGNTFCPNLTTSNVTATALQYKFGQRSYSFAAQSYVYIDNTDVFSFGTNDFTIDFWTKKTSGYVRAGMLHTSMNITTRIGGILFGYRENSYLGDNLLLYLSSNGTSWDIANGISLGVQSANVWIHWAISRKDGTFYIFRDGSLVTSLYSELPLFYSPTNCRTIFGNSGKDASFYTDVAYYDELCITKYCRYSENFTPPTDAYSIPEGSKVFSGVNVDNAYSALRAFNTVQGIISPPINQGTKTPRAISGSTVGITYGAKTPRAINGYTTLISAGARGTRVAQGETVRALSATRSQNNYQGLYVKGLIEDSNVSNKFALTVTPTHQYLDQVVRVVSVYKGGAALVGSYKLTVNDTVIIDRAVNDDDISNIAFEIPPSSLLPGKNKYRLTYFIVGGAQYYLDFDVTKESSKRELVSRTFMPYDGGYSGDFSRSSLASFVKAPSFLVPDGRDTTIIYTTADTSIGVKGYAGVLGANADAAGAKILVSFDGGTTWLTRAAVGYVYAENYAESAVPYHISDVSSTGVASSSGAYPNGTIWMAYKAFDRNTSTAWLSSVINAACYLQYKFNSPKMINKYSINSLTSGSRGCIDSWSFKGSNDGSNWYVLDTQTNQTANKTITSLVKSYTCGNQTPYMYYRLDIDPVGAGLYANVCEFGLYEAKAIYDIVPTSIDDISTKGMTAQELASVTPEQWATAFRNTNIDFAIYLDNRLDNTIVPLNYLAYSNSSSGSFTYTPPEGYAITRITGVGYGRQWSADSYDHVYLYMQTKERSVLLNSTSSSALSFSFDYDYGTVNDNRPLQVEIVGTQWTSVTLNVYIGKQVSYIKTLDVTLPPNSAPLVSNINLTPPTTHNTDVTLTADISDAEGEDAYYRVVLNGIPMGDFITKGKSYSITQLIPVSGLNVGTNAVYVETNDGYNYNTPYTMYISRTNAKPEVVGVLDKLKFSATINDTDGDNVRYQLLVNGVVRVDWGQYTNSPYTISYDIRQDDVVIGTQNTLTLKVEDEVGEISSTDFDFVGVYWEPKFSASVTIQKADKIDTPASATVASRKDITARMLLSTPKDIHATVGINPYNTMQGTIDISNPPKIVASLSAIKDAFITNRIPRLNYGSEYDMSVGLYNGYLYRSLVQFDLTSIPKGVVITRATLKLKSAVATRSSNVEIRNVDGFWGETSVTWMGSPESSTVVSGGTLGGSTEYQSFDVKSIVLQWLSGQVVNNGLMLKAVDETINGMATVSTRESNYSPILEVEYYDPVVWSYGNSNRKAKVVIQRNDTSDIRASVAIGMYIEDSNLVAKTFVKKQGDVFSTVRIKTDLVVSKVVIKRNDTSDAEATATVRGFGLDDIDARTYISRNSAYAYATVAYRSDTPSTAIIKVNGKIDVNSSAYISKPDMPSSLIVANQASISANVYVSDKSNINSTVVIRRNEFRDVSSRVEINKGIVVSTTTIKRNELSNVNSTAVVSIPNLSSTVYTGNRKELTATTTIERLENVPISGSVIVSLNSLVSSVSVQRNETNDISSSAIIQRNEVSVVPAVLHVSKPVVASTVIIRRNEQSSLQATVVAETPSLVPCKVTVRRNENKDISATVDLLETRSILASVYIVSEYQRARVTIQRVESTSISGTVVIRVKDINDLMCSVRIGGGGGSYAFIM